MEFHEKSIEILLPCVYFTQAHFSLEELACVDSWHRIQGNIVKMLREESHLFMFVPLHVRLLMSTPPTAPMSNDSLSTRVLTEHELYSC